MCVCGGERITISQNKRSPGRQERIGEDKKGKETEGLEVHGRRRRSAPFATIILPGGSIRRLFFIVRAAGEMLRDGLGAVKSRFGQRISFWTAYRL